MPTVLVLLLVLVVLMVLVVLVVHTRWFQQETPKSGASVSHLQPKCAIAVWDGETAESSMLTC